MARPRCPVCRSRRWHRDRQSGLVVCEEGHILQGYRQEDNEAEGPSQHATKRRKLRKNKERKATKTADPDLFHGPRLRFLYFQCAQILLRKQIAAIIETWGLPAELETIARDLWAMYVSLTDLEAEPFKEGEEEDHPSSPEKGPHDALQKLYDALSEDEDDSMPASSGMLGGNPTDDNDNESHHGDSEDNTTPKARARRKGDSQARNPARRLKLHYTLVICYLSCFTMRIPILMKDILDLARSYKVSYLEVLNAIPEDMRRHLDMLQAERELIPSFVLPVDDATKVEYNSFAPAVNAFAAMLNSSFGITFPEVNAAPILYKMVRDLSLPRELIHARRSNNWRLVTYTPIAFVYLVTRRIMIDNATSLSLPLHKRRGRDYPDLTLAASMVITLKLVWGLDGIPRIPQDANDMSSALPRLQEWLDFSERLQELYPTTAVPAAARTQDVASMKKDEIDEFLDFFQEKLMTDLGKDKTVLGTLPVSKSGLNLTDRFFPLHSPNSFSEKDPLNQKLADREAAIRSFYATASMPIPNEASSSEPLFPGQQYKIYSSTNFDNSLPSDYTRVLQLVSGVTGIHASVIEDAVRRLEHSIGKRELGWKAKHLPTSQAASQGREAMMWGRLRDKGGVPPWPRDLLPSVKTEEPEKERAILEPKFRG